MTSIAALAVALWFISVLVGLWFWLPHRRRPTGGGLTIAAVAALVVLTGFVAVLADRAPALSGSWQWVSVAVAAAAAVVAGGAITRCVLDLADRAPDSGPAARVQAAVLRGGAWIGALERLALVGTILARWPEGLAALIALKGLARYPELRTSQGSGASERFIIGTLASLLWAAACGGIGLLLLHPP